MSSFSPLRAIRAKCLECSGGSSAEVTRCDFEACPLHPFRSGHNPARAGIGGVKCADFPKTPNSRRDFDHEGVSEVSLPSSDETCSTGDSVPVSTI